MSIVFKCMASELARALNLCSQVSGREKQMPILKATKIEAGGGSVHLTATNMDHGIRVTIAGAGEGVGYIETGLLAPKASMLRQGEPVTITSDDEGKSAQITQGRTKWKVPMLIGGGFPENFITPIDAEPLDFKVDVLFAALGISRSAINPADNRIVGRGPFLDMNDGFDVIATDGHRFVSVRANLPSLPINVILPTDAITAIGSLFKGSDRIKVAADKNAITVEDDGVFYRTKLVEGIYPDWRHARDSQSKLIDGEITVDRQAFTEALGRVASISENSGKESGAIGVRVTIKGGECEFYARNRGGEEGTDYCEAIGDHEGVFGVGVVALKDMIGTIHSDRMTVKFSSTSTESAIILAPDPAPSPADIRFVMPMRV